MRAAAEISKLVADLATAPAALAALQSKHAEIVAMGCLLGVAPDPAKGNYSVLALPVLTVISQALQELSQPLNSTVHRESYNSLRLLLIVLGVFCDPLPPRKLAEHVKAAGRHLLGKVSLSALQDHMCAPTCRLWLCPATSRG